MTKTVSPYRAATPLALCAAAALAAAALSGCGPDFDPYNRLNGLRVLGIMSDPPNPQPGQTAVLSAILYPPEPDPLVTYRWSWCPFPRPGAAMIDQDRCAVTPEALSAMANLPDGTLPGRELGTGATAMFMHGVPPEQLAALCQSLDLPCGLGFPVEVGLTVTRADDPANPADTSDSIDSIFTLRLPTDPAATNTNPSLAGFEARLEDGMVQPLTNELVTLPRNKETIIRAGLTQDIAELYPDPDTGMPVPERLFLSWFVETGGTDDERTGTNYGDGYIIPVPAAIELARKNGWSPGKTIDYPAGTARLFVVIRDNRGGTGSASATVRLGDTP